MSIKHLDSLLARYPQLQVVADNIMDAFNILVECYENGGKLLIGGNGGSAADSEHIVSELMKSFVKHRAPNEEMMTKLKAVDQELGTFLGKYLHGALPAIAIDGHVGLTTACQNDDHPQVSFAQQVYGYGCKGDVFMGISTSGNSENIILSAITAKAKGMKLIGLTGEKESRLSSIVDVCIKVPEIETYRIQELHLPIYHCLCMMLEDRFF